MRAIGVVRPITLDPERPELDPTRNDQHGAINDYTERHGWELVDVVFAAARDDGDGPDLGLEPTLARLDAGEADVLVVGVTPVLWNVQAEARVILERRALAGWELVITGSGLDTTTQEGKDAITAVLEAKAAPVPPCSQPLPPAGLVYRVTGGHDLEGFDVSAYQHVQLLESVLGSPIAARESILDFGCGCGRLLRRLIDAAPNSRLVGCDTDAGAIGWVAANLPRVDAYVIDALPPLPFPDGSFDLVIGYSVFTHLDEEYQDAWLAELHRVLRPGGVGLLTIHGEAAWDRMSRTALAGRPELETVARERDEYGFAYWGDDGWEKFFPDYYHTSFHTTDYVQSHWAKWFEHVEVDAGDYWRNHDIVIVRR
jgi:SAM-dependent methyltransferase